jgi:hypothetical protein
MNLLLTGYGIANNDDGKQRALLEPNTYCENHCAWPRYDWLFLGYSWVLLEDSPMLGQECDLCIAARHMSGAAIEKLKFTLDLRFSAVAYLDFGP